MDVHIKRVKRVMVKGLPCNVIFGVIDDGGVSLRFTFTDEFPKYDYTKLPTVQRDKLFQYEFSNFIKNLKTKPVLDEKTESLLEKKITAEPPQSNKS